MTTKVTGSVLANTAITPGTYGGATQIPVFTVDQQGRATYAANSAVSGISVATTQLTGTFPSSSITGLATSATTDTTNAGNITSGTLPAARIPSTTVSAGNYGGTTQIPVVTIDAAGRATYAANVAISGISIATSQLSGTISSAQLASGAAVTNIGFTPYNATNPSGYITGITSGNVTTALGFTPYNATNPSGYITGITSGNVTTALGFTPYNATNPSGYLTGSTGVTSAVAGNGVAVSGATGAVTFSASCPTAGSVGSYCCIYLPGTSGTFTPTFGSNYSAGTGNQQVQTGSVYNNTDSILQQNFSGGLSGTWKYLGNTTQVSTSGTNTGGVVALGCRVA